MTENKSSWRKMLDNSARLWKAGQEVEAIKSLEGALEAHPGEPLLILQKYYMEKALEHRGRASAVELAPRRPGDPQVSVIMATYNRNKWIRGSVESVLNQKFTDWELILINDGGADEVQQIAESYSDPRIRYIRQKHGGLSSALNEGLRNARGKYVSFLDDDDLYYPEHLENLVGAMEANPDVLVAHTEYRLANQKLVGNEFVIFLKKKGGRNLEGYSLDADLLKRRNFITTAPALVRREGFLKTGGFNETMRYCVHWDLWIRMSEYGRIMQVPGASCEYRKRGEGTSMTSDAAYQRAYFDNVILFMHKGLLLGSNSLAGKNEKPMLRALRYMLQAYPDFINILDIRSFLLVPKPYYYFEVLAKEYARDGNDPGARAALGAALRAAPHEPKLWFRMLSGVPKKWRE